MLTDFFAIKLGMTQAWTKDGRRLAVTKLQADDNTVGVSLGQQKVELGYGLKEEKNTKQPQRAHLKKVGFKSMPSRLTSTNLVESESPIKSGTPVSASQVFKVGDLVEIQGTTKGRGFAGVMKRYGFHGGPKTHGQSDRSRAPGSIGSGTTPGRVFKGKRMPGHYGVDTQTIKGLVILHIDEQNKELWVSGPIPGHIKSFVKIHRTGENKLIELDEKSSGIVINKDEASENNATEITAASDSATTTSEQGEKPQPTEQSITESDSTDEAK